MWKETYAEERHMVVKLNEPHQKYLDLKNEILWKIHGIMTKLRTPKLAGELGQFTALQPVVRNKTRWLSTMNIVDRYLEIKGFVEQMPSCSKLVDYIPTAKESQELQVFKETFQKLHSVTKALQRENIDLCDARVLFEEVLKLYKEEEFREYLSTESSIVHMPVFESAVIKLLKHDEES